MFPPTKEDILIADLCRAEARKYGEYADELINGPWGGRPQFPDPKKKDGFPEPRNEAVFPEVMEVPGERTLYWYIRYENIVAGSMPGRWGTIHWSERNELRAGLTADRAEAFRRHAEAKAWLEEQRAKRHEVEARIARTTARRDFLQSKYPELVRREFRVARPGWNYPILAMFKTLRPGWAASGPACDTNNGGMLELTWEEFGQAFWLLEELAAKAEPFKPRMKYGKFAPAAWTTVVEPPRFATQPTEAAEHVTLVEEPGGAAQPTAAPVSAAAAKLGGPSEEVRAVKLAQAVAPAEIPKPAQTVAQAKPAEPPEPPKASFGDLEAKFRGATRPRDQKR